MNICENCGAIQCRDPGIFRDTAVCPRCSWWVYITPGSGVTLTAVVTAFLAGMFGAQAGPDEDGLQPA